MAYQSPEARRANYQLSMHKKRVEAEREWRLSLKVGDPIDAVKAATIKGLTIKSWSRGFVIFVGNSEGNEAQPFNLQSEADSDPLEGLVVDVKFDCDRFATVKRFSLSDWMIAPSQSFTNDWDWRYELKVGDLIDCMDDEKDWYKSTILDKRFV